MLTPAQLAAALNISERQVSRLTSAGMPCQPVGARGKRYVLDECRNWLKDNFSCLTQGQKTGATPSASRSAAREYIAASRRAHLRVTPSDLTQSLEAPCQSSEPRLSLVTPA